MSDRLPLAILTLMAEMILTPGPAASAAMSSTAHFDIQVPDPTPGTDAPIHSPDSFATELGSRLEQARAAVMAVMARMPDPPPFPSRIRVEVAESTEDFRRVSGRAWHQAAATAGNRILLQPVSVLKRLQNLDATLRHELAHIPVEALAGRNAPRWLVEGVVMLVARDRPPGYPADQRKAMTLEDLGHLDRVLTDPRAGAEAVRRAYRLSYHATSRLVAQLQARTGAASFDEALLTLLNDLRALRKEPVAQWTPGGVPVSTLLRR